jgi:hypothetical protein
MGMLFCNTKWQKGKNVKMGKYEQPEIYPKLWTLIAATPSKGCEAPKSKAKSEWMKLKGRVYPHADNWYFYIIDEDSWYLQRIFQISISTVA